MSCDSALRDAGILWLLDGEYARVVDAAVALILADRSTPPVDVLAGSSPADPFSERVAMVDAALDGLGQEPLPDTPDAVASEAAEVLRRQAGETGAGVELPAGLTCDMRDRMTRLLADGSRRGAASRLT